MNRSIVGILLLLILSMSGCTAVKGLFAISQDTQHFIPLTEQSKILYEPGAKVFADKINVYLEAAIARVERLQYGPFIEPVVIHIPASIENFSTYCTSKKPSACVIGGRLFLSPKLFRQKSRISGILTHELSHLHLSQYQGYWSYRANIPNWFIEGLAVYVAQGAGAENVPREKARAAIQKGKVIEPVVQGSLLFPKTASCYAMRPHMFYRQSAMFVEWLYRHDFDAFNQLLLSLQKGVSFSQSFKQAYPKTLLDYWNEFLQSLNS